MGVYSIEKYEKSSDNVDTLFEVMQANGVDAQEIASNLIAFDSSIRIIDMHLESGTVIAYIPLSVNIIRLRGELEVITSLKS